MGLRRGQRGHHPSSRVFLLTVRYANSNTKTWGQLSNAFRNSATRMMDEVINVQNKMGGTIFPPPTGSQRILYERLEDLPSLIDSINLSGADNTPSQNPSTPFHSLNLAPGTENPPCHDTERDKSNTAGEYAQVSDNIERLNGDQDVVADVTYTLEQVTKIVRFQRGWRRLLRLRNHKQKANLFAKRARVFDMYYNASKERT